MIKSNLVIQTAFLGDLILAVPTLRRIKEIFPHDKLIIVCKNGLGDFLIDEKIVDEVIEVQKSNSKSYKQALAQISQYDIKNIFCLHRSLRSQFFADRIRADKKIGFSSFLGFWIFDDLIDFRNTAPEAIRQFAILETTDENTFKELNSSDFSFLNSASLPSVPAFFSFARKVRPPSAINKIALFPGSVWATKQWTTSGFTELTNLLIKENYQVDLCGSPTEIKLCQQIAEKAPGARVRAGHFSIAETVRMLANYDLVISNDSAPTHMAAYNQTPVITIFGPTVLKQGFRPWSDNASIIENNNIACRPCGRHGHQQCPQGHHNCMTSITAAEVFMRVKKVINVN